MVYSSAAVIAVIFLFFVPLYHHCYVMNTRMHKAHNGTSLAKYFDNITEEASAAATAWRVGSSSKEGYPILFGIFCKKHNHLKVLPEPTCGCNSMGISPEWLKQSDQVLTMTMVTQRYISTPKAK